MHPVDNQFVPIYRVVASSLELASAGKGLATVMSRPHAVSTEVARVLRERRTVGTFTAEVPSSSIIEAALELATWAPNHRKTEPWRFYRLGPQIAAAIVALNADLVAQKKGTDAGETKRQQWSQIPGWLVVTCRRSTDALLQEEDYAACCCAIQNFALALWSAGIGTKWSTGDVTRHREFFQRLNINPDTERVVGLLWYGYPQSIPVQTRKPLAEFVRDLP